MSLAIWNAIWTPLTIAFSRAQELDERPGFQAINYFVDTIFWLDILLQFLTTYNDKRTGEEIFAPKKIALHYMFKGSFVIDFLSTFPFSQLGEAAKVH